MTIKTSTTIINTNTTTPLTFEPTIGLVQSLWVENTSNSYKVEAAYMLLGVTLE